VATPSHAFVEHTGEVELRLVAPDLPSLFAEAGRAVAELMLGEDAPAAEATVHAQVRLDAPDAGALLVAWIDELVYLSDTRRAVFTRFDVRAADERALEAEAHGVPEPPIKTGVKAATYHRLRVARDGDGWAGVVVLDV